MPATSTSPVKILLDLGIDLDNLSSEEDYLSALMEAAATIEVANKGKGDGRSAILRKEIVAVRKTRKAAAPSKGMKASYKKISASSFKGGAITKRPSQGQGINNIFSAGASQGEGGDLLVIKEKVVSIEALLGEQYKLQEDNAKDAKQEAEQKRRSLKERLLEGSGKVFDGVKKATSKVLKPFKSVWENIIGFIKKILLGAILFKILKWASNPENQGKIESIFKFLKDWWPVLLTAYLAFGNGLSKFVLGIVGKLAIWGAKLLATVIPALFKAVAAMGPKGWLALGLGAGAIGLGAYMSREDDQDLVGEEEGGQQDTTTDGSTEETQKLNKGGQVAGSGNTDTVPAMLTPGEFVMSKGAVQKYGANTLASMNAMGGGTNRPTLMGGFNEGGKVSGKPGIVTDPAEKARIEAETLAWVNKERVEFLGLPPLDKISYADGVELTKPMGKEFYGAGITEESSDDWNFDTMTRTTSKWKQRGSEMIFEGGAERITPEQKQAYFDSNPVARMARDLRDQREMDILGADISASAKKGSGYRGGGLVQGFKGGGGVHLLGSAEGFGKGQAGSKKFSGSQLKGLLDSQKGIGANSIKKTSIKKNLEISPPITAPKVTVINQPGTEEADASQAQLPPQGNREIPTFDAAAIRSSRKMEVLGIIL